MLKIENLHARVAGKDILDGLSLTVRPGEVHAIMGPNGAGDAGVEVFDLQHGVVLRSNGQEQTEFAPMRRDRRSVMSIRITHQSRGQANVSPSPSVRCVSGTSRATPSRSIHRLS